jgi:hypothetical protein
VVSIAAAAVHTIVCGTVVVVVVVVVEESWGIAAIVDLGMRASHVDPVRPRTPPIEAGTKGGPRLRPLR